MAKQYGPSQRKELSQQRITLDPRSLLDRLGGALAHPRGYAKFQIGMVLVTVALAFAWAPMLVAMLLAQLWYSWQRPELPMRYPKDLGGIDPTLDEEKPRDDGKGEVTIRKPADGILHIGNARSIDRAEHLKELWVTNSDARTHMLLMGTTGSGKTVTLLSLCFNALAWGSGFFYSDGKADSSLHAAVWSLCRRVGREDDYLVLNFITGGADPYTKRKSIEKTSNGTNPWYEGSPDFLSQLSSSLLPKASGDGAQWQQKAVNMMDAVIRTLCYERAVGNINLSIGIIREYLALPNLVKLYLKGKKGEIPEFAFLPIKAYLETGLPGFKPDQAANPDKWDQTVWDQHGYLTGQYARTLSMLMDTYGYIFKDKYSEVDMMDVLLNRRILVVMIPTLEKSSQEAANLGKLVVSSIRLMMAMNLGHKLEGTYKDIIETKATTAKAPYIIAMDELGYYFAEGIALMFAQARSLGFMMIAAGQDIAAMAKGENKEEVDSMIANTKIKYTLALEDPKDTLDIFKKVAGQSITVETGSYEGSVNNFSTTNYQQALSGSIQRRDRIELEELKALKEMQGVLIFKDQVVRARSFTWFHSTKFSKLPFRLNRFLQVDRPRRDQLTEKLKPLSATDPRFTTIDRIMKTIRLGRAPAYGQVSDPIALALTSAFSDIEANNPNETPINRGIAYYVAAVEAMRASVADGAGRYWQVSESAPAAVADGSGVADTSPVAETVPVAALDAGVDGLIRNPVYQDPPLQEKAKEGESFEDLVREFAEPPGAISSEQLHSVVPADYDAAPFVEDQYIGEMPESPSASESNAADFSLDDDLDAFLLKSGVLGSGAEGDSATAASITTSHEASALSSAQEKTSASSEVVIGFTERTADTLVKIEEALGSEDPTATMKSTESEISAQLKWNKPVDEMSEGDLGDLFSEIEATVQRSATRAK